MKKVPRGRPRRRKPSLGKRMQLFAVKSAIKLAVYSCLLFAVAMALYTLYVSGQVQERFAGRRWSMPSRVYSDTTLLYPGRPATAVLLEKKLKNLEYRPTRRLPEEPGEYRMRSSTALEVSLRPLTVPGRQRPAIPVRITLADNRIQAISNLMSKEPLYTLEIEPEEIMLFFGQQRERRELISLGSMRNAPAGPLECSKMFARARATPGTSYEKSTSFTAS
jgi:penicillin-binding protein 1B